MGLKRNDEEHDMTNPTELPPLFGSKGEFIGFDEATFTSLSEPMKDAYRAVRIAAAALADVESDIVEVERAVKDATISLRDVESKLAKMPKPSHTDLVRQMIEDGRRYG